MLAKITLLTLSFCVGGGPQYSFSGLEAVTSLIFKPFLAIKSLDSSVGLRVRPRKPQTLSKAFFGQPN